MRIGFIGDIHGCWNDLYRAIAILQDAGADMMIQVGDFGCWNPEKKITASSWDELKLDVPVYWIDGNHEDFPFLKSMVDWDLLEPQTVAENVIYIPRGTVLELGGLRFGFMGGGASIDRLQRIDGRDWFRDELPSYGEFMRLANVESLDVIVAHDCPEEADDALVRIKNDPPSNGNRRMLQAIVESHRPAYFCHGHYHQWLAQEFNGTQYVSLADGRESSGRSTVILDTDKGWLL